jgi:hypothetical protein
MTTTVDDVSAEAFPRVDFKFQNKGTATAFLHRFEIRVLAASVDLTPALRAFAQIDGIEDAAGGISDVRGSQAGRLRAVVYNAGWGDARNCDLVLTGDVIDEVFALEQRTFRGDIAADATVDVVTLDPASMNVPRLQDIASQRTEEVGTSSRWSAAPPDGLRVALPSLDGHVTDILGTRHAIQEPLAKDRLAGNFGGALYLTPRSFVWNGSFAAFAGMPFNAQYYVAIDPEQPTPYEKQYSISHRIEPGDLERFQVVLGSRKSCHARVQFRFWVDKAPVSESPEFDVHIWAPRDHHTSFADGDELLSKVSERAAYRVDGVSGRGRLHGEGTIDEANKAETILGKWKLAEFLGHGFPFVRRENP